MIDAARPRGLSILHVDPQAFQRFIESYGPIATPIFTALAALIGWLKRNRIASIFAPKVVLIAQRNAALKEAEGAKREARSAEAANRNQADSITALQNNYTMIKVQLDDMTVKFSEHAAAMLPMQQKVDALVDYSHGLLDHIGYLESQATSAGIKLDRFAPPVPKILADRFNVPETLR